MTELRTKAITAVVALSSLFGACATNFTGEAHVPGGPAGCAEKCKEWGQEFVGMVAMGEYSDACVCQVPGKTVSRAEVGAVVGGAAGVVMQMRRAQATQNQAMMSTPPR